VVENYFFKSITVFMAFETGFSVQQHVMEYFSN
jgi:hypothetical protein